MLGIRGADNRLNLVAVDQTRYIGVRNFGGREDVILFVDRGLVEGAEDLVKESEGTLGPDHEPTKVPTGRELKEVQAVNVDELNTRDVAERLNNAVVLVVDHERTAALTVTAVAQFTLAGTELARVGDLGDVSVGVESLEESDSLLSLLEGLDGRVNDERNLVDLLNAVTAGEDE